MLQPDLHTCEVAMIDYSYALFIMRFTVFLGKILFSLFSIPLLAILSLFYNPLPRISISSVRTYARALRTVLLPQITSLP